MTVIALLSPGAMGASVGAAAVSNGHQVLWHDHGRSEETRSRAKRAKLESVESEKELYTRAEIILSICPPHVANDIA